MCRLHNHLSCSVNLGNVCTGQPRFFWLVVVLHGANDVLVVMRRLDLEELSLDAGDGQPQQFLEDIFANGCRLHSLSPSYPVSRYEEQQGHGEWSPLLFDVVSWTTPTKRPVASKWCCPSKYAEVKEMSVSIKTSSLTAQQTV